MPEQELVVGDRVVVANAWPGSLRFRGNIDGALWFGVEVLMLLP